MTTALVSISSRSSTHTTYKVQFWSCCGLDTRHDHEICLPNYYGRRRVKEFLLSFKEGKYAIYDVVEWVKKPVLPIMEVTGPLTPARGFLGEGGIFRDKKGGLYSNVYK